MRHHLGIARPNPDLCTGEFLALVMNFPPVHTQFVRAANGVTRFGLNLSSMSEIKIPLPPIEEQKKIAEILRTWDQGIEKIEQQEWLFKCQKHGLMQKLLVDDAKNNNVGIEWTLLTINKCCSILDNKRRPLNNQERQVRQGEYPYYGANGLVDFIDDYIFDEQLILMAEDGGYFDEYKTRPIAYKISGRTWVNNHAHVLRPKDGYDFDYLFYTLEHMDIQKYLNGGTRAKLNKSELERIEINFPPLEEQRKIATILCSYDQMIKTLREQKKLLQSQKRGLMQRLLSGDRKLNS